jgi:hypothetical protein
MSSQQLQFLNLRNLPARLTAEEAAWFLGFAPHAIPILVAAGLLKPLGQPAPNANKHFATATLCELKQDTIGCSGPRKKSCSIGGRKTAERTVSLCLRMKIYERTN